MSNFYPEINYFGHAEPDGQRSKMNVKTMSCVDILYIGRKNKNVGLQFFFALYICNF